MESPYLTHIRLVLILTVILFANSISALSPDSLVLSTEQQLANKANIDTLRFQKREEYAGEKLFNMRKVVDAISHKDPYKFEYAELVAPAAVVTIGFAATMNDWVRLQNRVIRDEILSWEAKKNKIDDFMQFSQMGAAYGLRLAGVKGRHGYGGMTIILGTASLITAGIVNGVKYTVGEMRPDYSRRNSFPSGHTAVAFMGAEFLRREYWEVSPWIGVVGYFVASGTGFMRMYNNRHWLTDVMAGAAVGIFSVQAAYWLYPKLSKLFYPSENSYNVKGGIQFAATPYLATTAKGISCQFLF